MKNVLAVFLGGMIGTLGRYSLNILLNEQGSLPWGTFIVNGIGCFILSYFMVRYRTKLKNEMILFFGTGCMGAFTTFSTFSLENIQFLMSGAYKNFFLYVFGTLMVGLLLAYLGYQAGKVSEVEK